VLSIRPQTLSAGSLIARMAGKESRGTGDPRQSLCCGACSVLHGAGCRHAELSILRPVLRAHRLRTSSVCLHEVEGMEDATVIAQKVLSCVARTGGASASATSWTS
jgi:hypothetical protein